MVTDSDIYWSDSEEVLINKEASDSPIVVDIKDCDLLAAYNSTKQELERITTFASQLNAMVFSREYSDFTFTVNEQIFYAHKCILASHSPAFARIFQSPITNEIINDCESSVFQAFLEYLYTGNISTVIPNAEKVLPLADKYQVVPLKTVCECNIEIKNANAINVLILAKKFRANKLKERAIAYIRKNRRDIKAQYPRVFSNLLENHADLVWDVFD